MSRRTLRRIVVVISLAGIVGLVLLIFYAPERRVPMDVVRQARPGLTLAQVEELFGSPGKPVHFADLPNRPDFVLVVLPCPAQVGVKAETVRDPAATWRVWHCAATDGNDTYWVVYFREGIVIDMFGAGGPGWRKRLRHQVGL